MAEPRPFFHRVEVLRGLGAMIVATYHISGWSLHGSPVLPQWFHKILPGHAALMVFFIISGFVLRLALEYGPQQVTKATGKFLLARLFRVYPIVIVGVILVAVFPMCQVAPPELSSRNFTAQQWLMNLLLIDVSANATLWALQVELLMAPLIVALYFFEKLTGPRALLAVAIIATGMGFLPHWLHWPPLSANFFSFVLGMTLPTLGRKFARSLSPLATSLWLIASLAALVSAGPALGLFSLYSAIIEAYSALVIVSLVVYREDLAIAKLLDTKTLRSLGTCSGSFYVLHMAAIPPTIAMANALLPASVPGVAVVIAWLLGVALIARVGYRFIEAPGIALGKTVIARLGLSVEKRPTQETEPKRAAHEVSGRSKFTAYFVRGSWRRIAILRRRRG